jgi:hypothetical protein
MITGDDGANAELAALGVDVAAVGGEHIAKAGVMSALAKDIYNPASLSRTEIVAGSNRSWTWKPLRCG